MKNIVLIVAGGSGARMGSEIPKQYLQVKGKAIIRHTIEAFLSHLEIDGVKVVISKGHEDLYDQSTIGLNILPRAIGGQTRQQSVYNGLKDIEKLGVEKVLIHDAVRPFVSSKIISDVIKALDKHDAVDVGVKPKDTIKSTQNKIATLNRETLYCTQTPQGFKMDTIITLHEEFKDINVSDDITLALNKNINIAVVEGNYKNIKITTSEDLIISGILL